MIQRFHSKEHRLFALVAVLCLTALVLELWQRAAQEAGGRTCLDATVCTAARPLQSLLAQGVRGLEWSLGMVVERRRLAEENAALRTSLAELGERVVALEEERRETDRERDLRAAAGAFDPHASLAEVTGWGEEGWVSYLSLDRGEKAGLHPKDVALAAQGLVGQIYAVSPLSARVVPITDPASGVAVLVQRSRETGILWGCGDGRCELQYLDPGADVAPGDTVLTSGAGGIFPKGLYVGTIESVGHDPRSTGKLAVVRPAVKMRNVEEVAVVRAKPPAR